MVLGIVGVGQVGWALIPFLVVGPLLVIGYNFELFGGVIHNDVGFAAGWGPSRSSPPTWPRPGHWLCPPAIAALGAFALSAGQRALSTPARLLRRRATQVEGSVTLSDDSSVPVSLAALLGPLERALRATAWAIVLLAASLAVARLN